MPKWARQAEVGKLQLALVVDEQVRSFQVPVQDSIVVAEVQPLQQLLHVALDLHSTMTKPLSHEQPCDKIKGQKKMLPPLGVQVQTLVKSEQTCLPTLRNTVPASRLLCEVWVLPQARLLLYFHLANG